MCRGAEHTRFSRFPNRVRCASLHASCDQINTRCFLKAMTSWKLIPRLKRQSSRAVGGGPGQTSRQRMREFTEGAGLSDNELNSGQRGQPVGLGQLECNWKQLRQIHFPFAVVRTTTPSLSVLPSGSDSIRPDRSHSRCCRNGGRAARLESRAAWLENCDRELDSRDRPHAKCCANVRSSGDEYESQGMRVSIVNTHNHTHHVQSGAAIDQGMTSSEVPHRRQF